jgi:NAD(P)-dependent dehydrogenase (short-subunit alcohol dehydrogenase family)
VSAALVAGGATGIGRATVELLRDQGTDVYLADIDAYAAAAVVSAGARGAGVSGYHDLATADGPRQAVEAAIAAFGRLDAVIVCAALLVEAELGDIRLEDWDRTIATNLRAPFLLAQAAGLRMLARGQGSIINIASVGGIVALPRLAAYTAAKSGLVGMTRVMAVEWAPRGVRVNAVAPAYASTEMADGLLQHESIGPMLLGNTPLGRFAEAEEIAPAVVFLASSDASYITGQTICVDGGWTAQ